MLLHAEIYTAILTSHALRKWTDQVVNKDDASELIRRAFEQAKRKGKPDWQKMSLSVLNNRLLQLTGRTFDPKKYGRKDLRDLIQSLSPFTRLSESRTDVVVEWCADAVDITDRGAAMPAPPVGSGELLTAGGVREDLWAATIDYRSGRTYVWDAQLRLARVAEGDEELPVIPTLSSAEMDEWRAEFINARREALAGADLARALRWREQGLGTVYLPESLQSKWNKELSRRIRRRLLSFFDELLESASPLGSTPGDPDLLGTNAPLLNEELIRELREKGQTFAAGELLASAFPHADEELLPILVARVTATWASPGQLVLEPTSLPDLIARVDEFAAPSLAVALVNAIQRIKAHQRKIPNGIGDLAFRVHPDLCRIYGVDERRRTSEACQMAVASLEIARVQVSAAVDIFVRATASMAKGASLEILRAVHQLQPLVNAVERNYLRELEILLGSSFRKFFESYERNDDADVVRRAPELRENLARYAFPDDPRKLSGIWATFVSPVLQHVAEIVDEATSKGEASLSPILALVNTNTKTDLSNVGREIRVMLRVANTGKGQALDVAMRPVANDTGATLTVVEPSDRFSIGAGSDQLLAIRVILTKALSIATFPIQWVCRTAAGSARTFDDTITIAQQSIEPEWERLLSDPPYSLNPIKRRDRLYGRDSTLHQLRVAALAGASTFLWGQKRIGKTSLLQVLTAELSGRENTSCLLFRMGEVISLHEDQLAHRIAERLLEGVATDLRAPTEQEFGAGMSRLIPFVEKLVSRAPNHKFLVIIDEFDDLDPAFYTGERGRQFIKALRSLSEIGLTFFFVGSERMDLIYSRHQADLNKWRNLALDRIHNRADCQTLITNPVSGAIEYAPQAIDFIIDYCGGNPFYIHNFCYQVFERCVQEHRTFVSENDLQFVRQQLLQSLGQTNFAHFWEDNPELDVSEKARQTAENCITLTCIALSGGRYSALTDLVSVQESLPMSAGDYATIEVFRTASERLKTRKILTPLPGDDGFAIALPLFREWLGENADPRLLTIWTSYEAESRARASSDSNSTPKVAVVDFSTFPIPEDELIAVSQRLLYCGRQKDAAELRQWLSQFDDENRIEVAFLLLKRLSDRGFINEGSRSRGLNKITEMIQSRRQEIGHRTWQAFRGRLNNLCITYVDSEHKSGADTARELQKVMRPGKCGASSEISSWMRSHLDDDCIVVIADDFAGTGRTLADGIATFEKSVDRKVWTRYRDEGRIAAYVMFAFPSAIETIRNECPGIEAIAANSLGEDLCALDEDAQIFADDAERRFAKDILTQIGRELTPQTPLGFGELGALVVFHNAAPNNTLPIFWSAGTVNERPWIPLFPRA